MARTVIKTNVAANDSELNVLANTKFQFADNPGPTGAVLVTVAVTSDVADNEYTITADKDFVAQEDAVASTAIPLLDSNPGQVFLVQPGTQINVDLKNNNAGARDETEAMLAAQMAATHSATMTFARRLNRLRYFFHWFVLLRRISIAPKDQGQHHTNRTNNKDFHLQAPPQFSRRPRSYHIYAADPAPV